MKVKFIKKMLAVLCVASMSMSCVAGSVGAIEFVKGFEEVDVEGTQKYVEELNKSIEILKEYLYALKGMFKLKLGERLLDSEKKIVRLKASFEADNAKKQINEKVERSKRVENNKNKLQELYSRYNSLSVQKDDFSIQISGIQELLEKGNEKLLSKYNNIRLYEALIKYFDGNLQNDPLSELLKNLDNEKIDRLKYLVANIKEYAKDKDIYKLTNKNINNIYKEINEMKETLKKDGLKVREYRAISEEDDENFVLKFQLIYPEGFCNTEYLDVKLGAWDTPEKDNDRILCIQRLKPLIEQEIEYVDNLAKIKLAAVVDMNNDIHEQVIDAVNKRIQIIRRMFNRVKINVRENNVNDIGHNTFELVQRSFKNTVNAFFDNHVILSGNSDTNFNLREREEKERKEREEKERKEKEREEKERKEKERKEKEREEKERKEREEKERLEREKREREAKERLEREKREKEEKERLERQKLENDKKEKKKKIIKKIVKKKVVKKKSLNEHNKNLDNILNQIEVLSNEIQQAEKSKVSYIKNYKRNLSKINHTINEVRANLKEIKGAVDSEDFATYQAEVNKTVEQKRAEKSKLKDELEKDISNLEKQIQEKRTKKADLEKQLNGMLK